jgi:GPH family glycoside/pentoside/hexuronide:cation symporter
LIRQGLISPSHHPGKSGVIDHRVILSFTPGTGGACLSTRLSRATKILYGSGDIGFSLTSTILGAYFAIFLTDVVGLAPGAAAVAIFLGRSWDYINDPIIGHISDRTRSRWGRRRPFLLFGAVPFGLAFSMLWWRPPLEGQSALVAYYAVSYLLFDTVATFAYMPYFALTPELTPDYDERTALTSYRMFFSIFGSLVAFTVPLLIIGEFRPANAARVREMGLLFAFVSMLPLLLTFFGTREKERFMNFQQPNLRESLKAAARNRPFVFSAGLFLLTWVSITILESTLLFFIKYVVQREAQNDLIMATIFVTAIIALPFWEYASRRWDKKRAYIGGIAFWAVVQIMIMSLQPSTGMPLLLGLCILAGVGVSAAHVLPWSIIPDAIEWDELRTGERHEGMFYSLVTLMQKVASSIALPLVLLLLEFTGYVPNAAVQPQSALTGIRLVVGPIPAILLCAGIAFAVIYPLDRDRYLEVRRELEARRLAAGGEG